MEIQTILATFALMSASWMLPSVTTSTGHSVNTSRGHLVSFWRTVQIFQPMRAQLHHVSAMLNYDWLKGCTVVVRRYDGTMEENLIVLA